MIKVILVVLMTGLSASAFANGDQYDVVYDCTSATPHPDAGLNVQLLTGGFAGGTTIRVTRILLRHRQTDSFLVEKQKSAKRMGAGLAYTGQGVKFTINMTTSPLEDGRRAAVLETKGNGKENLKCEVK